MNALIQYINLYRENETTFADHSAPLLNSLRKKALESLERAELPTRRTEGYEATSLNDLYSPDFGLNPARINIPVDVAASFKCAVPHMSTLLAVVVNDKFLPVGNLDEKLPQGVTFMSLDRAARECPELISNYLGSIAPVDNPMVALNTLLMQDGVVIHVAKGVKCDRPLQLVNIFSSPVPQMAPRRVVIIAEPDSSLQLLVCDHTNDSVNSYLSNQVMEIFVGENARIDYCDIEESTPNTSRNSHVFVNQATASEINFTGVTLTCGTTRNDFTVNLNGAHCTAHLSGMAIAGGTMHVDNNTIVNHLAPHGTSNQLFKYTLDGHARGAFEGRILVSGNAPFTEAYQSNRNVLASLDATMHTKPQLEIYNDDVKCSHGATTGQLDDSALFYMRTRGIPEAEARTMLMQAFMTDVIDHVAIESLRERLRHLVDRRFHHDINTEGCGDCNSIWTAETEE